MSTHSFLQVSLKLSAIATRLPKYKSTLLRLWPKRAGNRQTLALAASCDLFRFKCSEHGAVRIIESACRAAGDDEIAERRKAVRSTYRKARAGESIMGTGARAPMTVFKASSWGSDLRCLPSNKRRAEAERRVLEVLRSLRGDAAGLKKCSCRSLAEMTGVSKSTVSKVLVDLTSRGVLKRESRGVVMRVEP